MAFAGLDLERFAREHHVHYDLEPGFVGRGDDRRTVEFDVKLFASHPGEGLAAPGCEKCVELAEELSSFARQIVSRGDLAYRAEVFAPSPVLYEPPHDRGTDEVALTVRVRCDSPEHRAERGDDACTRELRDRLAAVGVHQG